MTAEKKPKNIAFMKDQRFILVIVIILLVIIVSIINPKFIRLTNIMTILQQISVLGILTMAMAMLLISGSGFGDSGIHAVRPYQRRHYYKIEVYSPDHYPGNLTGVLRGISAHHRRFLYEL